MKNMNKKQILETIKSLAKAQGMYGRILNQIEENPALLDELVKLECKNKVDLVLAIEC